MVGWASRSPIDNHVITRMFSNDGTGRGGIVSDVGALCSNSVIIIEGD